MERLLLNDEPLEFIHSPSDKILSVFKGNCLFKIIKNVDKLTLDETKSKVTNKDFLLLGINESQAIQFEAEYIPNKDPIKEFTISGIKVKAKDIMYYDYIKSFKIADLRNILPYVKYPSRVNTNSLQDVKFNAKKGLFHYSIKTFSGRDYKTCMNDRSRSGIIPNESFEGAWNEVGLILKTPYCIIIKIDRNEKN